jgi:hypothetical protein
VEGQIHGSLSSDETHYGSLMALLLHEHRIAYVSPVKVGSTTVTKWLQQYGAEVWHPSTPHRLEGIPDDYFLFILVRHPLTRVPSQYAHHKRRLIHFKAKMRRLEEDVPSFHDWVAREYGERSKRWEELTGRRIRRYRWLSLRTTVSEHLRPILGRVDFVVHLERLRQELRTMACVAGLPWKQPDKWHAFATRPKYLPHIRGETIELIREKCAEDIKRFYSG